ncbi:MAG: EamA family transporter [Proteobacteria bacterium]|nr:EamA family transporter [Pseudomonadota bacterium]
MPEPWILLTVAAAFLQNIRSALQKDLKTRLSNTGATYVRFAFGAPFALVYLLVLTVGLDHSLPKPGGTFFFYGALGGIGQVLATATLLHAFSFRNFAVSTAYRKTEPLQAAAFSVAILGESVGELAGIGILVSVVGVLLLTVSRQDVTRRPLRNIFLDRGAGLGMLSAALFALAGVSYRAASLSLLSDGGAFLRAGFTLSCVLVFQAVIMTLFLALREPGQLRRVGRAWRPSLWVGICGAAASVGWFTAMTLQNVAYVTALGQVELLFAMAASWIFFRERSNRLELAGMAVMLVGIVILILES